MGHPLNALYSESQWGSQSWLPPAISRRSYTELLFPGGRRGRDRVYLIVQADHLAGDVDTRGRPKDGALLGAHVQYHGQTVLEGELIDHPDELIAQCL